MRPDLTTVVLDGTHTWVYDRRIYNANAKCKCLVRGGKKNGERPACDIGPVHASRTCLVAAQHTCKQNITAQGLFPRI
jgi:hypothetical protein